ncbi:MAG: phosphatidylinositol-binding protein scs2, partial [Ramalina farinacea]|nr:phosphatidylinositol-binding protein scs2 [Ramalina farinacea]
MAVALTPPELGFRRPFNHEGRIEVGSEVEVQVLLQAMREDPAPDAKCRDKFLVQSIAITPERDLGNITTIAGRDAIEEKKIRVVFLPADGTATTPNHKQVNGL